MSMFNTGAIVMALGLLASSASAATIQDVSLSNVEGEWTNTSPTNVFGLTGEGSNEIRWGLPSTLVNTGKKSGYGFAGAIPPAETVSSGEVFSLGDFTHFNERIMAVSGAASTIKTVDLSVKTTLKIGATDYLFTKVFTFMHDETPNGASNCKYGGRNGQGVNGGYGCNDRVTALLNEGETDELVVDGLKYTFNFSGFLYNGGTFDFFDTIEGQTNVASLLGSFFVENVGTDLPPPPTETPDLTPVPLPAAGWLLLAGIGGLAAVKRRKSKANA